MPDPAMKKPHQWGRIRLDLFDLRWRRLGLLGRCRRKGRYLGGVNVGGALTRGGFLMFGGVRRSVMSHRGTFQDLNY